MIRRSDGLYIIISTGNKLPIRTSTDRTNWSLYGYVFPNDLWAPDIYYIGGKYLLYYAASTFGSRNSAIFQAQSTDGLTWTDTGLVISSTSSSNYNAIDPNLAIDGSTWKLQFGSFWSGIQQVSISSSTGKPSSSSLSNVANRQSTGTSAIEAAFLYKHGSYWYLFTSWDTCCAGVSSTYNIRVTRSSSITGPFVDQNGVAATAGGGTLVLATHGSIYGPGGQSIMTDVDAPVLVYHYYGSSTSYLGINLLDFSSGWPVAY
ncbi:glycoside hydrolase family 43 protein [Atractiella rhizophila]|nr:glycoside hydrolase family 43 protein [Atractiella rhizophila]